MDEYDEEPWPFRQPPRGYPRPGQASREEAREHRLAGHMQQHGAERRRPA